MDSSPETSNTKYGIYSNVYFSFGRGSGWKYFSFSPSTSYGACFSGHCSSSVSVEPLEGVEHHVKEKVIDEREKVVPKRALEDEGDAVGSVNVKRGRMAPPQETVGSIPTFPSMAQISIPDSSDWTKCINIGSRRDKLDLAILEKLPYFSTIAATSVHKY
ncbi:hypothetical protein Fot_11521 [Forsythia ovata]|uniref:Uncharacterized protein n=1 Tax=Forsythia ovata TaxID=205694 RepID=A0ABD1WJX2_9LAMI